MTRWSRKTAGVCAGPQTARNSGGSPLRLRLVRVKIGKTKMWMLTSVLESGKLTKTQIVRLYSMRWGIEVEFRGLKQTLDRAKLRCRNDPTSVGGTELVSLGDDGRRTLRLKTTAETHREENRPGR